MLLIIMKKLSIGELAKYTEIQVGTIRYYEKRGLISKPCRLESGYRRFSLKHIGEIEFIKQAKDLGFSLKEISELRTLVQDKDVKSRIHEFIAAKLKYSEDIISDLKRKKRSLQNILKRCSGGECVYTCCLFEPLGASWVVNTIPGLCNRPKNET